MRPAGRRERRAVVAAGVSPSILEFGRLPVRPVALTLPNEFEVAVEALEAARPQGGRHLALQCGLGVILEAAHRFGYGEGNLAAIIALIINRFAPVSGAARQRNTSNCRHSKSCHSGELTARPFGLHRSPLLFR